MPNPRLRRLVVPALACVVTAAATLVAPSLSAPAAVPQHRGALQHDLDAITAAGATSALAVVTEHGRARGASAGPRVIGHHRGVDPWGRFRAGSVTKTFVATVALQLVDAGRVRLDAPVADYLPGTLRHLDGSEAITVRMLLDHTSGLYNYAQTLPLNPPSGFLAIRWRRWTPQELLSRATAHPLQFAPGSSYGYSDTDYLVLGMLTEQVTGHSPATEIRRRITAPLHLRDTYVPTSNGVSGPHAHAYLPKPDGTLADITRFDPSVLAYSGDVVSSGRDLNRFMTALTDGRLLRPATTRLMRTVTPPAEEYGLGVDVYELSCGLTAVGHDGDVPGWSTQAFTVPGTGRAVTVSMSWGSDRPKQPVLSLVDDALCGRV